MKKLKITCPVIRYKGKFLVEDLKTSEKTIDKTIIIKRGFKILHNIPKTDFLYFTFISLTTNSFTRSLYLNISIKSSLSLFYQAN